MKIFPKKYIIILLLAFNHLIAGGSPYSKFGIGNLILPQNTISTGRSATGLSITSNYFTNRLNPAGTNLISKTIFSADVYYDGIYMQDTKTKNFLSGIQFYGIDLAIPIATSKGFVFNLGLIPYSRVDYIIKKNLIIENFSNDLEYKGDGGLSNAYIGASYNIIEGLSTGIKLNYLFGNLYHQITQTTGAAKNEIFKTTKLHNLNTTVGLIYSNFGKLLGLDDEHNLNFGLIFSNRVKLNAEVNRYFDFYYNQGLVTQDTLPVEKSTFTIPAALGFGISYIYNKRYLVTSDIYFQDWSNTKLLSDMDGNLKSSSRFSFGIELLPYAGPKITQLQKVGVRAGMYYNRSYISINSTDINELGFTAGIDFPIFGETRFALSFDYGIRGDKKLQKDNIYKVTIGLIGNELWFIRPEEE